MTRILVLSDTHITKGGKLPDGFPESLKDLADHLQKADWIFHAGDHTGVDFYWSLQRWGNVISVCGNMDALMLRAELPERTTVQVEKLRIGMTHGWGTPFGLERRVYESFSADLPDVIIFGHSHCAHKSTRKGVLLFNPGSPTRSRGKHPTAGWLEIDGSSVEASIIELPGGVVFP